MILAAHQAQYLPYPGVIAKIDAADVFVIQDDLQYVKQEWQNRNRIRTPNGSLWLTIPVHASSKSKLCETMPANERWVYKHRKTIETFYGKSKHMVRLARFWEVANSIKRAPLSVINHLTTQEILNSFGIDTPVVLQSGIGLTDAECTTADNRLISICRRLGCDTYLSGVGAQIYMNLETWRDCGVSLKYQAWNQREYRQMFSGWIANLSSADLMLSVDHPLDHLRSDRQIYDYVFAPDVSGIMSSDFAK